MEWRRIKSAACALAAVAAALFALPVTVHAQYLSEPQAAAPLVYLPTNLTELLAASARSSVPGFQLNDFTVMSQGSTAVGYDDKPLANVGRGNGDSFTNMEARLDVASNWRRHALVVYAHGGGTFYNGEDDENAGYARVGTASRIDISRTAFASSFARYAFGTEQRGTGESFVAYEQPIETQTFDGGLLVHKAWDNVWTEIAGSARREEFFDARLRMGGIVSNVDQSFRSGNVIDATGRLGYLLTDRTSVFTEGVLAWRDYDDRRFDADGYELLIGLRRELSRLVNAEAAVGYMHYASADRLADIDTWTMRAGFTYAFSPLASLALLANRDVGSPSLLAGATNSIDTEVGLRIDYAATDNLVLTVGAGMGWVEYVDTQREDQYLRLTAGAEYNFHPWLALWASYALVAYDGALTVDADYDRSIVLAGVRARY